MEHKALIFSSTTYASLESALEKANRWIQENEIEFLNVETVLLPEIGGDDTTDTHMTTSGEMRSSWYQFIRVWYKTE
jgi:hypothetical protein